jgi:hypothetical protein
VIPANAEVRLLIRIDTDEHGATAWNEFGTYYIHNRDREQNRLRINCYDKIRMLEVPFDVSDMPWSTPSTDVLNMILEYLDMELDPRTIIDVPRPVNLHSEMNITMRQVLKNIGVMYCGNWHITHENKLRLVVPEALGESQALISRANSKKVILGESRRFEHIIIRHGSLPYEVVSAGGGPHTLTIFNPWAGRTVVNFVHSILSQYTYNAMEADSVEIDPAIELGDIITVKDEHDNTITTNLWQIAFGTRLYANIIHPADSEGGEQNETGGFLPTQGTGVTNLPSADWDRLIITDSSFTINLGYRSVEFQTPKDDEGRIIAVNGGGRDRVVIYE